MLQPVTADALSRLDGIRHGFFTRDGGVSRGLHASLNCGLGSADDRAAVEENRRRVADNLGTTTERLLTCHQVHSADAIVVETPWAAGARPKADGLVTRVPGIALGALAADCAPILLADAQAGVIGAAHAGWKGALTGIAEATVAAMERLGAARARVHAVVGPCIGPQSYEVGPEFLDAFLAADPGNAHYFTQRAGARRPHFALAAFVADRLRRTGVGVVEAPGICTYAEPERFFSYRRSTHHREPDYGRQISAIVLR